jgi:prolyl oligopeptidase
MLRSAPLLTLALATSLPLLVLPAQRLTYPVTRTVEQIDNYHGFRVPDPYRWLEDDTSAATKSWVEAQNRVTFGYLERIPYRGALRQRLTELLNYPRYSQPVEKGPWVLFSKNDGLQNQSVYYIQRGLSGAPEVLIDPNLRSPDGTTRIAALTPNKAASHLAYFVSKAGSDWQEIEVMELSTRRVLPDRVRWVKVSGIAWAGDGFFYSRYPVPADTTTALSSKNENHLVYFHKLGTTQDQDQLAFSDPAHPQRFNFINTTDDERFAILSISDRGQGKDGNALYVRDLTAGETAWRPIVTAFDDQYAVIDNQGSALLVQTNRRAKNNRIIRIEPSRPAESEWVDVVPERPEPIDGVATAGGRLFVTYLKDVTSRVVEVDLRAGRTRDVTLPGVGTVGGFGGAPGATSTFYTFTSFTEPATIYRYDFASGVSTRFRETTLPFDPSRFEAKQVFATSKDGTKVPMFIVAKKGMTLDGTNPTLLYGYGGFNISLPPAFSALRMAFLEQGGVYVQANLRGGAEYGDAWHEAGMKERKQNVFDDFIACAQWLIDNRYTSAHKLAIQGGSNGGLLVGAAMTQRPELFQVALPAVGVMDMLRFHKFTIGWNWIADYGSSDDAAGFQYLKAYSPLHNLKPGTNYPATLVTTADHDDRVVPAHSFKFAAALQKAHAGDRPVLIRIETQSGHGSSSTSKQIEETADVFAFAMQNLGMTPVFPKKAMDE